MAVVGEKRADGKILDSDCPECHELINQFDSSCPYCGVSFQEATSRPGRSAFAGRPSWQWAGAGLALVVIAAIVGAVALSARSSSSPASAVQLIGDTPVPASATIKVIGMAGEPFSGSLGGPGSSHSVSGVIPATFKLDRDFVYSAVIQKKNSNGNLLTVILTCPQGTTTSSSTSTGFGVASVSGRC